MFNTIKTKKDIENFLDKTNALHDGYIIGVQYTNGGITKLEYGHHFNPEQTKLIIQVLVTSIFDAIVEIEFENPVIGITEPAPPQAPITSYTPKPVKKQVINIMVISIQVVTSLSARFGNK